MNVNKIKNSIAKAGLTEDFASLILAYLENTDEFEKEEAYEIFSDITMLNKLNLLYKKQQEAMRDGDREKWKMTLDKEGEILKNALGDK